MKRPRCAKDIDLALAEMNARWRAVNGSPREALTRAVNRCIAEGAPVYTELTPIGEQYVIPGCEKHERPAGSQLKLWEA